MIKTEWELSEEYMMEPIVEIETGIVEISEENSAKTFALVRCIPAYDKCYNAAIPNSSSALLKPGKFKMEQDYVFDVVKAVNTENSTHLSNKEMEQIAGNIVKIKDLDNRLEKADLSIFEEIYRGIKREYKGTKSQVNLLSFASKFCHFYCWHRLSAFAAEKYPIIDNVMQKVIPIYDYIYNSGAENFDAYKKASLLWKYRNESPKNIAEKCRSSEQELSGTELFYSEYVKVLTGISEKTGVSVTGTEQLIWYYNNGQALPTKENIEKAKKEINK